MKSRSNWLGALANIGVILGLFFVGVQIYQDRKLKEAEILSQYFSDRGQQIIASMGENPQEAIIKAAYAPSELTPEQTFVYRQYLILHANTWDRFVLLEGAGLYPSRWQNSFDVAADFMTEPGEKFLKESLNDDFYPGGFVESMKSDLRKPEFNSGLVHIVDAMRNPEDVDDR